MFETENLGEKIRTEFETYILSLHEEEQVKKWLLDPRFSIALEKCEGTIRASLSNAIEKYQQQRAEAGSKKVLYRGCSLALINRSLDVYLETCERILGTTVHVVIEAFESVSRG